MFCMNTFIIKDSDEIFYDVVIYGYIMTDQSNIEDYKDDRIICSTI